MIEESIKILNKNGVILCQTDTVYGLICNAESKKAVEKIYKIKKREENKKLSIFVKDINSIKEICRVSNMQFNIMEKFLPGKFTFILESIDEIDKKIPFMRKFKEKSIGIRIPNNDFLLQLLFKSNKFLASTSANISSEEDSYQFEKISNYIKTSVDLSIQAQNETKSSVSTVIDLRDVENNLNYKIIRESEMTQGFLNYINSLKI